MPIVEYMLLECPIRAPHPQMERSDWTLLTTSVSPLASSDMCVAIGQVQEYSVGHIALDTQLKGTVQRKLTWVKSGINRKLMI
jgi:hypothetical protein